MNEFFSKLEHSGYLDSVISDLEDRLELIKKGQRTKETLKDKTEALENHIKVLEKVKDNLNDGFESVQKERKQVLRRNERNI
tara:strand:- start:109 stop:354 length:246 start_codon:yes stop_codon:yes gene_type:complete